jgi:hypothetical protein
MYAENAKRNHGIYSRTPPNRFLGQSLFAYIVIKVSYEGDLDRFGVAMLSDAPMTVERTKVNAKAIKIVLKIK